MAQLAKHVSVMLAVAFVLLGGHLVESLRHDPGVDYAEDDVYEKPSHQRSLCNTFGGCSSRSLKGRGQLESQRHSQYPVKITDSHAAPYAYPFKPIQVHTSRSRFVEDPASEQDIGRGRVRRRFGQHA